MTRSVLAGSYRLPPIRQISNFFLEMNSKLRVGSEPLQRQLGSIGHCQ